MMSFQCRDALSVVVAATLVMASPIGILRSHAATQPDPGPPVAVKVHAFRLYTGADGNSHVQEGYVPQDEDFPVVAVRFKITAPHSPPVWHNDPEHQYVVTMTGTLKFSTKTGESFSLRAGDVLIAEDSTGSGHGWEMVGDEPWTRTYAILPQNYHSSFVALGPAGGHTP